MVSAVPVPGQSLMLPAPNVAVVAVVSVQTTIFGGPAVSIVHEQLAAEAPLPKTMNAASSE
jgi:hypothetical protein